jgi:hypothetical protein
MVTEWDASTLRRDALVQSVFGKNYRSGQFNCGERDPFASSRGLYWSACFYDGHPCCAARGTAFLTATTDATSKVLMSALN